MKVKTLSFRLRTHGPNKLFDITEKIRNIAGEIEEGILSIFAKGSTGSLVLLPKREDIVEDFERDLWDLVDVYGWSHPGNAYAHLRSTLMGTSLLLVCKEHRLLLPEGYGVFFVENQPYVSRERTIIVVAVTS